jgi:butyryl-CoA dehydrogenase
MTYRAPVDAIRLSLETVGGLARDMADGRAGGLTPDDLTGILCEAARFAEERLAPQNQRGDRQGCRLADGVVSTPDGWPGLYRAWAAAGWNGVDLPTLWGGMGLPARVAVATMEMWTSANMAFALGPVLTQGAADAIERHGSELLKLRYLPGLVSGDWTATMNLTEPQAGSDLGMLRTRAERGPDGAYRISGGKIFITYGAHDLTEQIVHLVLARLPDAPPGTKGISLFLVPKLLPDGSLNTVRCNGLEHKLGIHASPTCSMNFDGAAGWLVGEENRGLACMFTMMNKARLFTGLQGVAIAERAFQRALEFARTRRQGRAPGSAGQEPSVLIEHPDVRRNLAAMRALTAAGRALAHAAARAMDLAHVGTDAAERSDADERAAMLTPIVKAWCSDMGCDVTSIGIQIHGGMGYVEETGAAQHFRDARITPIYEGTNGIQAIDLVTRKVLRPNSVVAETLAAEYAQAGAAAEVAGLAEVGAPVIDAARALADATAWLRRNVNDHERLLGAATPYLKLFGLAAAAALLAETAVGARRRQDLGAGDPVLRRAIGDAAFFARTFAVAAPSLAAMLRGSVVPGVEDLAA